MKEELKNEFENKFIRPLTNDDNYMWEWRNIHFLDIIKWVDKNFVPVENRVRQGRSLPDVACGRIKECEHFLGLTEKLSWLKESEEHDLFVSMIKMRIEYLKQDDSVKKAMTDTLKELINESKPSA